MDGHHTTGTGDTREGPPSPGREMGEMPLSEDEQRILREIEENLSATDPKLVQQVSDTTLYRHSARVIKWAVVGFVAGLLLMVFTFTTTLHSRRRRVPGDARVRAGDRAQRPQARAGRHGEPHRVDAQRRVQEHARQRRESLARTFRPRRSAVLSGRRAGGLHRHPGRPALGVQQRPARRLAPHRAARSRRRPVGRPTRSATWSPSGWWRRCSTPGSP